MPADEVVERAKSLVGTKYDLLTRNCRDVVRYAHKLGYVGKLVTAGLVVVGIAGLVAAVFVGAKALKRLK